MKKDLNIKCITNKCKQCKDYLKCFEYKPRRNEDKMELEEAMQWLNDFTNIIAINKQYIITEGRLTKVQEAIETVLQELESKNYKAISYTSEYFRGMNECEDKWKKKIENKIKTNLLMNLAVTSNPILDKRSRAIQQAKIQVLQELLEDK